MSGKGTLNKTMLIGHVGQDPDVRYMPNGTAAASFSVATAETWKDKQTGQPNERTEWHRCVVYGALAEKVVQPFVRKGLRLYLEGQIRTRKWQDQQGADRYTTEIVVKELTMLGGSRKDGASGDAPTAAGGPRETPVPGLPGEDFNDDIPF